MKKETWYKIVNRPLRWYLRRRFNLHSHIDESVEQLDEPFVFIGNHVTNWDPFIAILELRRFICYITSDEFYRNRFVAFFARQVGTVPITKYVSDVGAARSMLRVKKNGDNVGIDPEGGRNWTGRTMELIDSTAKALKTLRMPVVCAVTKGGYLSTPRWGRKDRRGRMEVYFRVCLTADDITRMTVEEIRTATEQAVFHSEYTWQRDARVPYQMRGKRPAESAELLLYQCLDCGGWETLHSNGRTLRCSQCGTKLTVDEYGFFNRPEGSPWPDDPERWYDIAHGNLRARIDSAPSGESILRCQNVEYWTAGRRGGGHRKRAVGTLALNGSELMFVGGGELLYYPVHDIRGASINKYNCLDFYRDEEKQRFVPRNPDQSMKIWLDAIHHLAQREERR